MTDQLIPLRVFEGVVQSGLGSRPQALHKVLCLIPLGVRVLDEGLSVVGVRDGGRCVRQLPLAIHCTVIAASVSDTAPAQKP